MISNSLVRACLIAYGLLFFSGMKDDNSFQNIKEDFISDYGQLGVPEVEYDYRNYFRQIPAAADIEKQSKFFNRQQVLLEKLDRSSLTQTEVVEYDHLQYEVALNKYRLDLERQWIDEGRPAPENGLYRLTNRRNWYQYFTRKFTSVDLSPEEIFSLGEQEVKKVTKEIAALRMQLGFKDDSSLLKHIGKDTFFLHDKGAIISGFERIDSIVRTHVAEVMGINDIPPVHAMEWPEADVNTPPGIYLNRRNTGYGKDVFQFNFFGGRYSKRATEWLYMHEAIPGHHLQSSTSTRTPLQQLFLYPGNFEGWACYVEYLGKNFGLYKDPYSYLGKWEWDLVRSARLVLDVGIHYYGWDRQKALAYWKQTVPGQDDIAEREITRVTNWCGQALSYKVGADFIMKLKKEWMEQHKGHPIHEFHLQYLKAGAVPLPVLRKQLIS